MSRFWIVLVLAVGAFVGIASPARAANYAVGTCLPKYTSFTTIQGAVLSVPPFSTILVCPGVYREQVTISQPLTLRGQAINNTDRPVIALPPNGIVGNVTSIVFPVNSYAAQVLVQNVNPAGPVSIIGMTVDGSGDNLGCAGFYGLAGIFFTSGTSGSVTGNTVRGQQDAGCGIGIWAETAAAAPQKITIGNNSVHDFDDNGIVALSNQNPPTLTATIEKNVLTASGDTVGIFTVGIGGTITGNVVTGTAIGIVDSDFFPTTPGITISTNTAADIQSGSGKITGEGTGISVRAGSTASMNKVSNTPIGFDLEASADGSSPTGPSLLSNVTKNTTLAVEFNCIPGPVLKSNTFNDSQTGFDKVPTGFVIKPTANPYYNLDTIQTGSCP